LLGQPGVCEAVAVLADRALATTPRAATPRVEPLAPHYARGWLARQGGAAAAAAWPDARWRTTIDAGIQRQALALLRDQMAELQGRQVEDGAVVVLDNASGEVLAWVGSSGARWSDAAQVDAVLARRQPGSTIKPFVYALAFEQGLATPASLLHDAPADLDGGSGAYMPRNYDHHYRGWVSARTALAASLNVPAARLAVLLSPQALFEHLQAAGLDPTHSGGHHGLALALGSADVTLLQLANAYRMLANGGRWSPVVHEAARSTPWRRVITPATAFQIGDILSDAGARAPTFGLDSALVTRGWAAVKTGTSKDMRDNWCVGYTDRYTVGVWIGNARGEPMHRVSGTQGAAPVWRSLVQALHARVPSRSPVPPAALVARRVEFDDALEPARTEWLARDSAMPDATVRRVRAGEQIAGRRVIGIDAPRDGTIVALDPDMPAAVQRIALRGEPGQWWLDGRLLGQGARLDWRPWPGHHRLELRDVRGRTIDAVAFEVRGARVAR
jgi:penicillin-binding protein 1C